MGFGLERNDFISDALQWRILVRAVYRWSAKQNSATIMWLCDSLCLIGSVWPSRLSLLLLPFTHYKMSTIMCEPENEFLADFLGAGGPPLKRIKSESLPLGVKSEPLASPLYTPNSVPPQSTHWGSPNGPPSVLSPYSVGPNGQLASSSPSVAGPVAPPPGSSQQQGGPPSAPSRYGGPGTPVTPGTVHNPPSVGLVAGTSPGVATGHQVQQQSSIENANSVAGLSFYIFIIVYFCLFS